MMLRRLSLLILLAAAIPSFGDLDPHPLLNDRPRVTGTDMPKEFEGVGITEHLGDTVDLGLEFTNDDGRKVHLGEFFQSGHPVLLAMVYYTCPNLCNYQLNGMMDAMLNLMWSTGQDYQLVAVSMNHREDALTSPPKKSELSKVLWPAGRRGGLALSDRHGRKCPQTCRSARISFQVD